MNHKCKPTHRKHHRLYDYKSRCIYHITLVMSDRVPLFGRMVGETVDEARVEFTPLGQEIANAIQMIPMMEARKGNDVQILGAATMPEHIYFVLFVRKPMKEKLGLIICGFKQGCNKALRGWLKKAGAYGGLGKSTLPNRRSEPVAKRRDCQDRFRRFSVRYGEFPKLAYKRTPTQAGRLFKVASLLRLRPHLPRARPL